MTIGDTAFSFARKRDSLTAEAALDGIYIIRTSVSSAQMDAPQYACRTPKAAPDAPTFEVLTTLNAKQRRALELLQQIRL